MEKRPIKIVTIGGGSSYMYRKNDERAFSGERKNEVTILMDNRMASAYAEQGTGVEQNGKIFV